MIPFALLGAQVPWKLIGGIALAVAVFAGGVTVGTKWSAAEHADALKDERDKYAALDRKVQEQNKALEHLNFQYLISEAARIEAEKRGKEKQVIIERRIETVTKYEPKDCEDALQNWWGVR